MYILLIADIFSWTYGLKDYEYFNSSSGVLITTIYDIFVLTLWPIRLRSETSIYSFAMADSAMVSILVLISTVLCVGKVYPVSVDSCPMYGCRPSGTFSYILEMTSNVGMAWPRSFIQGPLTNSLGCAANNVNIVCQAKGLQHEYDLLLLMNLFKIVGLKLSKIFTLFQY